MTHIDRVEQPIIRENWKLYTKLYYGFKKNVQAKYGFGMTRSMQRICHKGYGILNSTKSTSDI